MKKTIIGVALTAFVVSGLPTTLIFAQDTSATGTPINMMATSQVSTSTARKITHTSTTTTKKKALIKKKVIKKKISKKKKKKKVAKKKMGLHYAINTTHAPLIDPNNAPGSH